MFGKDKKGTINIKLIVVTAAGTPVGDREVPVEESATIAQILETQGISTEGMEISVNGKPTSNLSQKVRSGMQISVTERPKGS